MANLLLFEDNDAAVNLISVLLDGTEHQIIDRAKSISEAQVFLSQIIAREIAVDVILLDGNLDKDDPPGVFRHAFPTGNTEPVNRRRFGRAKSTQPDEIVVIADTQLSLGADARMVKRIMDACDITIPTIGISSEPMASYDVDVTYDLRKDRLQELSEAVTRVTANLTSSQ